ncbi:MAG: SOS response-associated peptidase [Actinomycetes bacterium]
MCGRYALKSDPQAIAAQFDVAVILPELDSVRPNFNTAPTHAIPVILNRDDVVTMGTMTWGLIPSWAKDPAMGSRMINARVETITEKPAFRSAIHKRRCIIPADGWYEWQTTGSQKVPHYFSATDQSIIGFAGIYERWSAPDGLAVWSTSIITTQAQAHISQVHERMPLLISRDVRQLWLADGPAPLDQVRQASTSACEIACWTVDAAVGNVRNNNAELITPIEHLR